jgi:hypothetical protein
MSGVPNSPVVSFRVINYQSMVEEMWGPAWNMNDIAYEMSNGRKFESTDKYTTGIYSAHLGSGRILLSPQPPNPYPDMYFAPSLLIDFSNAYLLQEP